MSKKETAENKLADELETSRRKLLEGESNPELLHILQQRFPAEYRTAYVVDWIPEQAEDIFVVLLSGEKVVTVELSRLEPGDNPVAIDTVSVHEYLSREITRTDRRKIHMAVKLSSRSSEP